MLCAGISCLSCCDFLEGGKESSSEGGGVLVVDVFGGKKSFFLTHKTNITSRYLGGGCDTKVL